MNCWRQINVATDYDSRTRLCVICETVKPFEDFFTRKGKPDGWCKPCASAFRKYRYNQDPEYYRSRRKEYYHNNAQLERQRTKDWTAANKERVAANKKAWNEANAERNRELRKIWYDANADAARQKARQWIKDHPVEVAQRSAERRASLRKATPKWLNAGHHAEIYGYYLFCNIFNMSVDHLYPINGRTVRGLHVPWNMGVLTFSENASKNNKMPDPATIAPYIEHPVLNIDAEGFASLEFPNG